MDGFELNKIGGALTGALLIFLVMDSLSVGIFRSGDHADAAGGDVHVAQASGKSAAAGGGGANVIGLLSTVDPARGKRLFAKCKACHTIKRDGASRVGPALWGVMGRDIASIDGFAFSDALAEKQGVWTWEAMDAFLEKPRKWAPGTKMSFAGLPRAEHRAALMLWMNMQSTAPLEIPAGQAKPSP